MLQISAEEYRVSASRLGAPISDFLTSSEFTDVLPDNVVVPGNGQIHLAVSMVTMLGSMAFVFVTLNKIL